MKKFNIIEPSLDIKKNRDFECCKVNLYVDLMYTFVCIETKLIYKSYYDIHSRYIDFTIVDSYGT